MENKIVVHMKDGTVHKGVTQDFDPASPAFHVLPAEGGGVPRRVAVEGMKALFYVKDYIGNRDFVARQQFDEAQRSGRRTILTFTDGETMWGFLGEASDAGPGFHFFPLDEQDNNIRVFVVRSSLKEMKVVS
ncbi:MAG: hypothetical protein LAO51_12565 [Acidobacteriia bacterium]|jgi:hypothetical protein|nr:hypothetical protein [Terriglobia bacterium]